mgnify:CR=1 FL=1
MSTPDVHRHPAWFGVVMGESSPLDERSTENRSTRVALPPGLARLLTMDLSLEDQRTSTEPLGALRT